MGLRLIIEDEEGATTIVPLGEEEVTIGREPGNTIQLTEQNVSRQHARLTQGPDGWVIEDLDSYNGVKVNGVLVEGSVTLNEGDVVQIGDYHLALSNNVEQTTLNLDRPSQAANDAARAMPSVDLPRIGAVAEPGHTPAFTPTTHHHEERPREEEEREGGGKGVFIGLGLVVLLGLGFAAFKFIPRDGDTPVTKAGVETRGDPPAKIDTTAPKKAITPPTPPVDTPPDPSAGTPPDSGEPPDPTNAVPDPVPDPPVKKTTPKKETPKKETPKKEIKPDEPKGDPAALLDQARKASLANNATQAYELAKKSYDIDKNVAALQLMGVSACKMGDHNKAKSAYKKLEASRQKQLQAVCAEKGITLE
jgi:pSer/pThr/pTyr-binding forkhead associated (FHA) protein